MARERAAIGSRELARENRTENAERDENCPQQDQRAVEALAAVVRKNPLLCIVILLKANYDTPKHSL